MWKFSLPAQRLHAVVRVVGNFLGAEKVLFDPGCHGVAPWFVGRASYFQPMPTILRRMNAICVASGRSFGQTSWQASSDMQPNTPLSSPITS